MAEAGCTVITATIRLAPVSDFIHTLCQSLPFRVT
jgi:hypothetical protein